MFNHNGAFFAFNEHILFECQFEFWRLFTTFAEVTAECHGNCCGKAVIARK